MTEREWNGEWPMPPAEVTNWYVLGFDGERGDRIVNALTNIGMFEDAAYVQAAKHVEAVEAAAYIPTETSQHED